ncbi:HAMP domain-containing histidine kinase [Geobacter sp. FeAm09]|uniref:sensor histidine kinase n=1 Tax=Geobacter sp. FeAm09 TaxID=2597769 RepID=UPI0011EF02CB|nr:HAMP domain-containing sensor histidine kinase [Geobacter sp. FeAm09]QEM67883.1 HAMP domain-containing histidine kinase [Geobacter sp. FeAm09]
MNLTDDELIQELSNRFARSRKTFSDLSVVNRKLVEMNRRLEQSEALKSNFLSNIRNEINNPLNAIVGLAGQIGALDPERDEIVALASMICSEANHLDFQLRNIFAAAELEAGELDPHISRVNVTAVARDVAESFRHRAARKDVEIELEPPPEAAPLLFDTDAEKVQIILSNLVANALEYSREGGRIQVSLALAPDGSLVVGVRDFGAGIAEEDQQRIFNRFTQLETGTTRSHLGHGLGLSIAKALADLLQGTIDLESGRGQGSLFRVTLPAPVGDAPFTSFAEGGNLFLFDDISEK